MLDAALANEGDTAASIRLLTKQFSFPPQRPIKEAGIRFKLLSRLVIAANITDMARVKNPIRCEKSGFD